MTKNTLAWIIASKNISEFISPHKFMIEKICKNFDELWILNLIKFKIYDDYSFIKPKDGDNKFFEKNNLFENKIKIHEPKNEKELKILLKDKKIVGINNIGKSFSDLKIHFILKKNKIKMVHFANIGNLQFTYKILKGNIFKGILFKLKTNLSKKIIRLLSNLKLVPKNEITFTSDINVLKNINKSKIKNFLYKNNLLYSKKIEIVNSRANDIFFEQSNKNLEENQITYLDINLYHEFQVSLGGKPDESIIERHYKNLNNFLNNISKILDKKIVVCVHPRDNLKNKKEIFKNFEVHQNVTRENIVKSYLVIFFESSAIIDAVLMKKRIITLISDYLDENVLYGGNTYREMLGIFQVNIGNYKKLYKEDLIYQLNKNINNYDSYIRKNIRPDGESIGYEKIFKIIKEELFVN